MRLRPGSTVSRLPQPCPARVRPICDCGTPWRLTVAASLPLLSSSWLVWPSPRAFSAVGSLGRSVARSQPRSARCRKGPTGSTVPTGAAGLYREGPHARSNRRGAPVAERARKVHVDYVGRARALDHAHSRQADGTPYPGVREQVQRHLVGPVLAALRAWDPVVGLVVGSYQGCSEGLHALAREVAEERARTEWRRMGARSEHEALGIFVHDVHRRWGSVFWRSWARVIRGRLPAIGRPNAEILHHGPPPAYARGQAAVGGAEPWPQVHPGILRGVRAAAGL